MLKFAGNSRVLRPGGAACLALATVTLAGCEGKRVTIADTFPQAGYASPWHLENPVWSGSLGEATPGLGEEAERWAAFEPEHVWLANYRHDTHPRHRLTARVWAFLSAADARRAFEHFRPENAGALEAGDEACWMDDGILVLWGCTILDIFSSGTPAAAGAEQAVYLLAFFEKQMPPGLPDAPQ